MVAVGRRPMGHCRKAASHEPPACLPSPARRPRNKDADRGLCYRTAATRDGPPLCNNETLGTRLVTVWARAHRLCVRLAHVLAAFGLAVPLRARTVIDLRRQVHPNCPWATALGRRVLRRACLRRRRLGRLCGRGYGRSRLHGGPWASMLQGRRVWASRPHRSMF